MRYVRFMLRKVIDALTVVPAMLRRMLRAMKYAREGRNFAAVAGAAVALISLGTITYSFGEGWNVIDGFYFAVATLTTTGVADPHLTLTHDALKIFTFLLPTGIGILVELARELGVGYVTEPREATRRQTRHAPQRQGRSAEAQSAG